MNCLKQLENGIFSTENELQTLASKENAKLLVVSDTHGSADILKLIIQEFGHRVDGLVFTGDGIYDLISVMEKAHQYNDASKWLPPVIAFIKGNNDPGIAEATFCENIKIPSKVIFKAGSKNILLTHGHNESVYYETDILEATALVTGSNAVFFGHTHVPAEILTSKAYLMNPGSVGYPRRQSKPGFAVAEIKGSNIITVFYKIDYAGGMKFVPYFPEPFF